MLPVSVACKAVVAHVFLQFQLCYAQSMFACFEAGGKFVRIAFNDLEAECGECGKKFRLELGEEYAVVNLVENKGVFGSELCLRCAVKLIEAGHRVYGCVRVHNPVGETDIDCFSCGGVALQCNEFFGEILCLCAKLPEEQYAKACEVKQFFFHGFRYLE